MYKIKFNYFAQRVWISLNKSYVYARVKFVCSDKNQTVHNSEGTDGVHCYANKDCQKMHGWTDAVIDIGLLYVLLCWLLSFGKAGSGCVYKFLHDAIVMKEIFPALQLHIWNTLLSSKQVADPVGITCSWSDEYTCLCKLYTPTPIGVHVTCTVTMHELQEARNSQSVIFIEEINNFPNNASYGCYPSSW